MKSYLQKARFIVRPCEKGASNEVLRKASREIRKIKKAIRNLALAVGVDEIQFEFIGQEDDRWTDIYEISPVGYVSDSHWSSFMEILHKNTSL